MNKKLDWKAEKIFTLVLNLVSVSVHACTNRQTALLCEHHCFVVPSTELLRWPGGYHQLMWSRAADHRVCFQKPTADCVQCWRRLEVGSWMMMFVQSVVLRSAASLVFCSQSFRRKRQKQIFAGIPPLLIPIIMVITTVTTVLPSSPTPCHSLL